MKKLIFKYLDTKYSNKLEIETDIMNYLNSKVLSYEKYEFYYLGKSICALFIYPLGSNLCYINNSLSRDLRTWFGLSLSELNEMIFEWALNKKNEKISF